MSMKQVTLSQLIEFSKDGEWGKDSDLGNYTEMYVIRGTDFADARAGDFSNFPVRWIPNHIAERKKLEADDILIELAGGTPQNPTGRTCFITKEFIKKCDKPLTCASFSRFIRLDKSLCDPNYIYWVFQFLYDFRILKKYHVQHTGTARFQWTTFSNLEVIEIPSISTQQKIASILSAYDELIENNTQRIALLEQMAEEIYKEWFVRLRFPGCEEVRVVDGLPEGWKNGRVDDILELQRGFDLPEQNRDSEGNVPVFASSSIVGYHSEHKVNGPGIVTGRSGTVGIVSYIEPDFWPLNTTLWVKKYHIGGPLFALIFLQTLRLENFAGGSAVPSLDRKVVHSITLNIPSSKLVNLYENLVKTMQDEMGILRKKNENLKQTRDLLLLRLMSGKLSVAHLLEEAEI